MGDGNTRRDNLLARLVGVGGGAEPHQRFICDAPPGAGGRRPVAQEGAAQMDRNGETLSEAVLERWWAQSRRQGRIQEGVAETGFRWDGELRDRLRSGRARTGEGSPDSSPPKEKSQEKYRLASPKRTPRNARITSLTWNINLEQSKSANVPATFPPPGEGERGAVLALALAARK